jgi:hypothetical protein
MYKYPLYLCLIIAKTSTPGGSSVGGTALEPTTSSVYKRISGYPAWPITIFGAYFSIDATKYVII